MHILSSVFPRLATAAVLAFAQGAESRSDTRGQIETSSQSLLSAPHKISADAPLTASEQETVNSIPWLNGKKFESRQDVVIAILMKFSDMRNQRASLLEKVILFPSGERKTEAGDLAQALEYLDAASRFVAQFKAGTPELKTLNRKLEQSGRFFQEGIVCCSLAYRDVDEKGIRNATPSMVGFKKYLELAIQDSNLLLEAENKFERASENLTDGREIVESLVIRGLLDAKSMLSVLKSAEFFVSQCTRMISEAAHGSHVLLSKPWYPQEARRDLTEKIWKIPFFPSSLEHRILEKEKNCGKVVAGLVRNYNQAFRETCRPSIDAAPSSASFYGRKEGFVLEISKNQISTYRINLLGRVLVTKRQIDPMTLKTVQKVSWEYHRFRNILCVYRGTDTFNPWVSEESLLSSKVDKFIINENGRLLSPYEFLVALSPFSNHGSVPTMTPICPGPFGIFAQPRR